MFHFHSFVFTFDLHSIYLERTFLQKVGKCYLQKLVRFFGGGFGIALAYFCISKE